MRESGGAGRAFPRRDERGRMVSPAEMLGVAAAGLVVGFAVLVGIDAVFALTGLGEFGEANGWLAAILPLWMLAEDFRAWRGVRGRVIFALVALAVGVAFGALAVGALTGLPALLSGGIAAALTVLVFVVTWFYGIRWLAHRSG